MLDLGRSGGRDLVLREEGGRQIGSEGVEVGRAGKLLRGCRWRIRDHLSAQEMEEGSGQAPTAPALSQLHPEHFSSLFSHSVMSSSATAWPAAHQAALSFTVSPELAQTRVHWVGDAIQPSCPVSSTFSFSWSFVWSTLGVTAMAFVTGALGFWAPKFLFEARVVHGLLLPCFREPCNSQDR